MLANQAELGGYIALAIVYSYPGHFSFLLYFYWDPNLHTQ
jgi:hypothetical protein